jgi:hypothetical protein
MKRNFNPGRIQLLLTFLVLSNLISCRKENDISNQASTFSVNNSKSSLEGGRLVGWYTFNGDVLDHSGYNNNINFNNATPTEGKSGTSNTAYYFDGVNSYMTIPNSNTLNPRKQITLAAFIKPTGFYQGTCHRNTILYKASDDNTLGKYLLAYDDMAYYNFDGCYEPVKEKLENFYGSFGDGQATAAGVRDDSTLIHPGNWYAVIFTYDGQYAKLYINGILKETNEVSTTFTPNNVPVYIGKSPAEAYPYWFTGVMDEIRIYAKALSESEIQQLTKQLQSGSSN